MSERLELTISYTDKKGTRRYNKVGVAWPSQNIPGAYTLQIDPGVALVGGSDHFINLTPPKPKADDAF